MCVCERAREEALTLHTSEFDRYTHPVTRTLERMFSSLGKFPSCLFSDSPSIPHSQSAFHTLILNFHSVNHVIISFLDYAEVETRIEALRELLLEKLLETPSTLHDQKRYIR